MCELTVGKNSLEICAFDPDLVGRRYKVSVRLVACFACIKVFSGLGSLYLSALLGPYIPNS